MSDAAPGTVAHEVIQHLRLHGETSTAELARQIGRDAKRLAQSLNPSLVAGLLARRMEGGYAFWRLGHNIDRAQPPAPPSPEELDSQRIVQVSALSAPSIFAYADQRQAAPFSVAMHTDGRLSIERHGRLLLELNNDERGLLVKSATHGVVPA